MFVVPSILVAYPDPSQIIQPHIITLPPPNFIVPSTNLSLRPSPSFFYTKWTPSEPRQLILASSENPTHFQSFRVQYLCLLANSRWTFLAAAVRRGFFCLTMAFRPA